MRRESLKVVKEGPAAPRAPAAWGLLAWIGARRLPEGVIGQADAMTAIQVRGGLDPAWILAGLGTAAILAAAWLTVRAVRRR